MKVVNNKVNIGRGETATYTLNVKYYDNNEPFHLQDTTPSSDFIGVLTVKDTVNNATAAIQYWLDLKALGCVFSNAEVVELKYNDVRVTFSEYTSHINDGDLNILYVDKDGVYGYYTKNTNNNYVLHENYEFKLDFPLKHEDTAVLEPKRYVYDINILQGNWATGVDTSTATVDDFVVVSKYVLVEPTDFIIGGSLSG